LHYPFVPILLLPHTFLPTPLATHTVGPLQYSSLTLLSLYFVVSHFSLYTFGSSHFWSFAVALPHPFASIQLLHHTFLPSPLTHTPLALLGSHASHSCPYIVVASHFSHYIFGAPHFCPTIMTLLTLLCIHIRFLRLFSLYLWCLALLVSAAALPHPFVHTLSLAHTFLPVPLAPHTVGPLQ